MPQPIFAQPSEEADYQAVLLAYRRAETGRKKERLQIVLLSLEGKTPPQIAPLVKQHVYTVRYWLDQFNCGGIAALEDKPHPGRTPLLTPEKQQQTIDWVKAQLAKTLDESLVAKLPLGSNRPLPKRFTRKAFGVCSMPIAVHGKRPAKEITAPMRHNKDSLLRHLIRDKQNNPIPGFFLRRSDFSIKHQYHLHLGRKRATADNRGESVP